MLPVHSEDDFVYGRFAYDANIEYRSFATHCLSIRSHEILRKTRTSGPVFIIIDEFVHRLGFKTRRRVYLALYVPGFCPQEAAGGLSAAINE